jgi:hypothetical protein
MSWLVQYRATSGALVNTTHDTRREAFETLADSLLASALVLWGSPAKRFQERGDHLVRHALRLCVEAEEDSPGGYLLRLSQGRKWVVCPV